MEKTRGSVEAAHTNDEATREYLGFLATQEAAMPEETKKPDTIDVVVKKGDLTFSA